MNIEQSRTNMIEQQIRTWNVLDPRVLDTLSIVKREHFVPHQYRNLSFFDTEIPLPSNAAMFSPKIEARILQEADVKDTDRILEIGAGSGYMAALLGHLGAHVTTIDIDPELAKLAEGNLSSYGITNVDVILGDGAEGFTTEQEKEYDVIVISGALRTLPDAFLKQLRIGGRLIAIIGEEPVMTCQLTTRESEKEYTTKGLFELCVAPLEINHPESHFTF